MSIFKPTWKNLLLTLFIVLLLSQWYVTHLHTLFNPYSLPSCWDIFFDNGVPRCASPFRSFTYGVPIALLSILMAYVTSSLIVTLFKKPEKKK